MSNAESYGQVVEFVQKSKASSASKKKPGHKPKRRDFKNRVFPKASIRALAKKAGIVRMAYGPAEHGYAEDATKDTYGWIDMKTFNIMENVLYDAIAITQAAKRSNKGKKRIIKERHMLKALERYGGLGLSSVEGRKTMY